MSFYDENEEQLVGYNQADEWWSGIPTAGGQAVGAGLGAGLGMLACPAAPIAMPLLSGLFGAIGGAFGSMGEADAEPVYAEPPLVPFEPFQVDPTMQQFAMGGLQDQNWLQPDYSMAQAYGVQSPYGFG